jgi:hypothetical protein
MAAVAGDVGGFGFAFAIGAAVVAAGLGLTLTTRVCTFLLVHKAPPLSWIAADEIHFTFVKVGAHSCRWLRKEDLRLLGVESIITGGLTVVVYALVLVSIYRVFQIGTDVTEMKELLKDIKNNTAPSSQPMSATVASRPESPEALVRAVHSASYEQIDDAIADTVAQKPA